MGGAIVTIFIGAAFAIAAYGMSKKHTGESPIVSPSEAGPMRPTDLYSGPPDLNIPLADFPQLASPPTATPVLDLSALDFIRNTPTSIPVLAGTSGSAPVMNFPIYVQRFAYAIAVAEGFFAPGDTRPKRNHNPGNLTLNFHGVAQTSGMDGIFVIFRTDEDGWRALYSQVQSMFDNSSSVYNNGMSIKDVAGVGVPGGRYTATDPATWAMNVAATLSVSADSKLYQLAGVLS